MIRIDGSIGGGSVVRVAAGLSAATGKPFRLDRVREGRSEPGLRHQHLAGLRAAAELVDAELEGDELGSQEVVFRPGERFSSKVRVDIPTAGSVGLALQPLMIASASLDREVEVTVDGGATAGKWAPPVHYLEHVKLPLLERRGLASSLEVRRHGFYPEGGALVKASLGPSEMERMEFLEQGKVSRVEGVSVASTHLREAEVAERQREEARRVLKDSHPSLELDIDTRYVETTSPGSVISLHASTDRTVVGSDALGEKGKPSEEVGSEAAQDMTEILDSGSPLDVHMSDQVVPLLGLAGGEVMVHEFTDHVGTCVEVTRKFVEKEYGREGRRIGFS